MKDFTRYHKKLWNNIKQIIINTQPEDLPRIYDLKNQALEKMELPELSFAENAILGDNCCFACVEATRKGRFDCQDCPLIWGTEDINIYVFCKRPGSPYYDIDRFLRDNEKFALGEEEKHELIRLCEEVANLPVKTLD